MNHAIIVILLTPHGIVYYNHMSRNSVKSYFTIFVLYYLSRCFYIISTGVR